MCYAFPRSSDSGTRSSIADGISDKSDGDANNGVYDDGITEQPLIQESAYEKSRPLAELVVALPSSSCKLKELAGEAFWISKNKGLLVYNVMLGRSGEFSTNDELHTHLTATLDKKGKIRVHLQVTDRRVAAISGHHLKGELPAATRKEIKEMSEVLQAGGPGEQL